MNARALWLSVAIVTWGATAGPLVAQNTSTGNAEAAKRKNPVAMSAESIGAGQKVYERRCATCHGKTGGGAPARGYNPATPSLVDAAWLHGSSDGELFEVIAFGVPPDNFMEPYGDRLSDLEIWHVVNYIRSLAAPAK